jgi:hypothetical protein
MAVYQETTTVSATRPHLWAASDPRDVSYPSSSHLPSRLSATIAGALSQPACLAGVTIPNHEEQSST